MHDDTVRVDDALAVAFGVLPKAERGTARLAHCRTDRYGEAIDQATQLASWEDEGGAASS